MSRLSDTLDLLTERGEAAFAIDATDRVVFWNRHCEKLLGYSAQKVLGRHCYEVLGGRDINGNLYCFRNCPVAHQARNEDDRPVNRYSLLVKDADGKERRLSVGLFAVPAIRPSLSSVVHVVRLDENQAPTPLERDLAEATQEMPKPLWPLQSGDGQAIELTPREKEILHCMAEGLSTDEIAERLSITPVTVRNHTQSILQKLDVHTKLAAVVFAFRHSLI